MWTRWKLLQRRRGTRVLLYHFHFAAIVMCVSLLSPCSLNVADGLQRSFVAFLYVPASRTYFPLRYLSLLVRFLTVFLFYG